MPHVSKRNRSDEAERLANLLFHLAHFTQSSRLAANVTHDTLPAFHFKVETTPPATLFVDPKHFVFGIPERTRFVALVELLCQGSDKSGVGGYAQLVCGRHRLRRRRGRGLLTGSARLGLWTHPFWTKVHRCCGHCEDDYARDVIDFKKPLVEKPRLITPSTTPHILFRAGPYSPSTDAQAPLPASPSMRLPTTTHTHLAASAPSG